MMDINLPSVTRHRTIRPSLIIGPIGCPDLQLGLVALLPVGFMPFTEQFLAHFSFCLIVLKEAP